MYRKNKNPNKTHAWGKANPLSVSARSADMFSVLNVYNLRGCLKISCSCLIPSEATPQAFDT
uniref:Uncharacterized protein n=1 Tax=Candidatus Kentrum sp. TUN TaxID=2126343 RepID=A0A451A6T6_9GAMM|nr:MAG: hypothetical protein BECKTUN1418E_GA0071001_10718 [Candidatus Kentron sp. TUN]